MTGEDAARYGSQLVTVQASYESQYDQVVQPDRIIGVPEYFIRHIPHLGSDLAWMYLAFRQAAYQAGTTSYAATGRFSASRIARYSGIVPRTFWNRASKPETWEKLGGLVQPVHEPDAWQKESDLPVREANKYIVAMTLPLIQAHANSLQAWLLRAADQHDPDTALRLAAERPLDELLTQGDSASENAPQSVFAIARELFEREMPAPRLNTLASRLHRHIMGNRLEITHFFAENVLPYLGTGPGLMWVLLRHFTDGQPLITVPGGYAEIASWLGLSRPMTIWEWFNGLNTAKRSKKDRASESNTPRTGGREASIPGTLRNPILPLYVLEVSAGKALNFAHSARTFAISHEDVPMELLADYDLPRDANPEMLEAWLSEKQLLAHFAYTGSVKRDELFTHFAHIEDTRDSAIFTHFAYGLHALCTPIFTHFAYDLHALCTVFKLNTTPHSFADAKEKGAADAALAYPQSLNEALEHPDIQLYQKISGCFPEQPDWVLTLDYFAQVRRRHPDQNDEKLAEAGAKYFAEWSARNYQASNPMWLHWWLNSTIPPRKAKRTRQSEAQTPALDYKPNPAPVKSEKEVVITDEDLAQVYALRQSLVDKGIMKPRKEIKND